MQPDMKYGSVSCSDARVKCEALDDVWITPEAYNQEHDCQRCVVALRRAQVDELSACRDKL